MLRLRRYQYIFKLRTRGGKLGCLLRFSTEVVLVWRFLRPEKRYDYPLRKLNICRIIWIHYTDIIVQLGSLHKRWTTVQSK